MLNKLSCKVIRFRAYHTTIIYHIWAWRKAEGIFRGVFVGYIFSFWPIALHAPLRSNSSNIARGHVDLLKLSDWGNRLRGFPVWEALKIFENYWKLMTSPNILISYIKYIYIYTIWNVIIEWKFHLSIPRQTPWALMQLKLHSATLPSAAWYDHHVHQWDVDMQLLVSWPDV